MAITWVEQPATRPVLRLVEARGPSSTGRRQHRPLRRGARTRLLVAFGAVGAIVGLALPLSALGGQPARGGSVATPTVTGGSTASAATVYVVRTGDTVGSIAARFDPGDPGRLARALDREAGSATVVPGERLLIP